MFLFIYSFSEIAKGRLRKKDLSEFLVSLYCPPSLPTSRILSSLSLRKLMVGHNHVQNLPVLVEHTPLEVLDVQHNLLTRLPDTLFAKALK